MSTRKLFTSVCCWESQSELHYTSLLFHIHHALPRSLRDALHANITRHGGQVADLKEEDPHPAYILIDTRSLEGQNFAHESLGRGPPPEAFVSWTYITACICENSLVNTGVVRNTPPTLIDPESQQPLLININSSLDGSARAHLLEKIGRHGGLVVSQEHAPRVIICHPISRNFNDLCNRFTKPSDPYVEMPTWLDQCIKKGCITFGAQRKHPRPPDQKQQETSSLRHKPPFQSAFLRWMGRDLEFESEDDAVAPLSSEPMNPLDDMSEFRPAAFKRKTTDDSIVVLSRRSRPRLQDNRRSDLFRRRYEKNGTTKGAGPSPSHYPVLISKNDDSLRGQVLSACRSSGQGDIPTLGLSAHQGQSPIISNVNHSPAARVPRIPSIFTNIRNPRIAKALETMSRKFRFIPEEVLATFNCSGGDLQKTNNILERNRTFLDDQSRNETLG